MKKHYGFERTALTLSGKALAMYDATDPLDIYETETDDGLTYTVAGCFERSGMTEDELVSFLSDLYDEIIAEEAAQ